ncbi:MAG: hypothetical protein DMG82_07325 [Acidobacteria bacterium]|nr:MAG: hypothetical protein DMG82_07325 [Acidobacteriota bacterium]
MAEALNRKGRDCRQDAGATVAPPSRRPWSLDNAPKLWAMTVQWTIERLLWPVKPKTPYPVTANGLLPGGYEHSLDPLDTLTYAAARTKKITLSRLFEQKQNRRFLRPPNGAEKASGTDDFYLGQNVIYSLRSFKLSSSFFLLFVLRPTSSLCSCDSPTRGD